MKTIVSIVVIVCSVVHLHAQDKTAYEVQITTSDQSRLNGKATFPDLLSVKTKYGEMKISFSTVRTIVRSGGSQWQITLSDNSLVNGECTLGEIKVTTSGGDLTVKDSDLQCILFTPPTIARPPVAPQSPRIRPNAPPETVPAERKPVYPGYEVRSDAQIKGRHPADPAMILPGGKHAVLLDSISEECVFVELATGKVTKLKVEGGPTALEVKNGKIYVANGKANSISIIELTTFKTKGRIQLEGTPKWLAGPKVSDILYLVTLKQTGLIEVIDTSTDKIVGTMKDPQTNRDCAVHYKDYITVSPDNRFIILQYLYNGSPGATPSLFQVEGYNLRELYNVSYHNDHPGIMIHDFSGGRIYCGCFVYTADMKSRVATIDSRLTVVHPTKNLIFGAKKGNNIWVLTDVLTIMDEKTFQMIKEVPIGDDIVGLLPSEEFIYVLSRTHLYPIKIADIVPADKLAELREKRIPVDLDKLPDKEAVKKADAMVTAGIKAMDAGKFADARKQFEEAMKIDPLSIALAELGVILVREKKFTEAVEHFANAEKYPFRDTTARLTIANYLGVAYGNLNETDKAIKVLTDGLILDPKNPLLLKNLGVAYANAGKPSTAYIKWSIALQARPTDKELINNIDNALKTLMQNAAKCETCNGEGKFTVDVEDSMGRKSKLSTKCSTCKGKGKTWKKPCVECEGDGRVKYDEYCRTCMGEGYTPEPVK